MPAASVKKGAAPATKTISRSSGRDRKPVDRYRPSSSAEMPSWLSDMIRDVAASAAAKSTIKFEANAVVALEESLEPMLELLCEKAIKHAEKAGRKEFTIDDLKAVSKDLMKK